MTAPARTAWRGRGLPLLVAVVAAGLSAIVPLVAGDYTVGLGINLLSYTVLATAWALFSGPTRYISLATVAFFGVGAYTVAVANEALAWPLVLVLVALIGAALAALVGLSTLRLSGVYFVIFTFGLSELIRQLATWYEVNVSRSLGRYIFTDITSRAIYWQLLGLAVVLFIVGWAIKRSRLGLALRMIGDDEPVARHMGVDTTGAKLSMFVLSSVVMSLAGAIVAPRYVYLDPSIAFRPTLSFMVVIMALLGGAGRLLGPLLGAVPLVLLFEVMTARFPNRFTILLGVIFIVIVYFLPDGVIGLFRRRRAGRTAPGAAPANGVVEGALLPAGPPQPGAVVDAVASTAKVRGASPAGDGAVLLDVRQLDKAFGGLQAVQRLDLELRQGEILGLIGPNGSGKTTVLNLISGALRPDAGGVELRGQPVAGRSPDRIARLGVARTFQLVRVFPSLTCLENVMAGFEFGRERLTGPAARREAEALLERVGLAGMADVAGADMTYIDQKRLELARALALRPQVLLLDEWLAGLNPSELAIGVALLRDLQRGGITMIMVEHVMDAIRSLCDRCVVMSAGVRIADGRPDEVLADAEVVRAYLGADDG